MKKMIKKLVAVVMMITMVSIPVFAKNGDMYYNEQLATWYKEVHIDSQERVENQSTGELIEKVPMGKNIYIRSSGRGNNKNC